MMKEATKQSKLKKLMLALAPVRILKKARQLYMKSVVECAGGYGVGASHHQLPMTNNIQRQRKLVMHSQRQTQPAPVRMKMKYSNSTHDQVITNMGRIDEDKPCYFEEDQMD
ncbi:hypothetical protein SESBI_31872 [Sesbania bispinosa]|nr:hypothetical protein SESBI_31872 [Sesbania bispinosa]